MGRVSGVTLRQEISVRIGSSTILLTGSKNQSVTHQRFDIVFFLSLSCCPPGLLTDGLEVGRISPAIYPSLQQSRTLTLVQVCSVCRRISCCVPQCSTCSSTIVRETQTTTAKRPHLHSATNSEIVQHNSHNKCRQKRNSVNTDGRKVQPKSGKLQNSANTDASPKTRKRAKNSKT